MSDFAIVVPARFAILDALLRRSSRGNSFGGWNETHWNGSDRIADALTLGERPHVARRYASAAERIASMKARNAGAICRCAG